MEIRLCYGQRGRHGLSVDEISSRSTDWEHRPVRIAYLGFGNVNRALHALLDNRRATLASEHDIEYVVTGVASRRLGWFASESGLDPHDPVGRRCAGISEWLAASRANVVFEGIPLEPSTGQPALDYLRAALAHGAPAISAN